MNEDLVQKVSEKNGSFNAPSRHSRNFTKKHSKKLEDLPTHQAMTDSGDQKFHDKQRGFHVSPVLGFLRKNLGRPWDLVYSDLCKIAKSDDDRQFIKPKLSWYVTPSNEVLMIDGKPHERSSKWSRGCRAVPLRELSAGRKHDQMYVNPVDGLLKLIPPDPKPKKKNVTVRCIVIDKEHRYYYTGKTEWNHKNQRQEKVPGVWKRVTLALIDNHKVWQGDRVDKLFDVYRNVWFDSLVPGKWVFPNDVLFGNVKDLQIESRNWGFSLDDAYRSKGMFALKAETCNKKDLKKIRECIAENNPEQIEDWR